MQDHVELMLSQLHLRKNCAADDDDDGNSISAECASDVASMSSSTATSAINLRSTAHANKRFMERAIVKRQFQSAVKNENSNIRFPGLLSKDGQSTVLLVHDGFLY
jgi:hypothetical protein